MFHGDSFSSMMCHMDEMLCSGIPTSGFEIKMTVVGLRCRWNLKSFSSLCCFAEYIMNIYLHACRTCSTIICPVSTNSIIVFWRFRCRRRHLNSLKCRTDNPDATSHTGWFRFLVQLPQIFPSHKIICCDLVSFAIPLIIIKGHMLG